MKPQIIVGDRAEELRAVQLLGAALIDMAVRIQPERPTEPPTECRQLVVPPLLNAAANSLFLAGVGGLDTPMEVLALAARNTFELWLRFKHVTSSQANCQRWRNENLTDQLQIYEAILTLPGPSSTKDTIRDEMRRLTELAQNRGIERGGKPIMAGELAKEVGEQEDYAAFYKLYSKLVHPSSWSVNSPSAVATPMYRQELLINAQIYGWRLMHGVEEQFGISAERSYEAALQRMPQRKLTDVH